MKYFNHTVTTSRPIMKDGIIIDVEENTTSYAFMMTNKSVDIFEKLSNSKFTTVLDLVDKNISESTELFQYLLASSLLDKDGTHNITRSNKFVEDGIAVSCLLNEEVIKKLVDMLTSFFGVENTPKKKNKGTKKK